MLPVDKQPLSAAITQIPYADQLQLLSISSSFCVHKQSLDVFSREDMSLCYISHLLGLDIRRIIIKLIHHCLHGNWTKQSTELLETLKTGLQKFCSLIMVRNTTETTVSPELI